MIAPLSGALLGALLAPAATPTPDAAIALYVDGDVEAACAAFDALRLERRHEPVVYRRVLRYVGVCRFMQGDKAGASSAFDALLDAEPAAVLSTDDFPPAVVEFFNRTKTRHAARVVRSVAEDRAPLTRRITTSPYLPFGAHQFARGDDDLGQFLLTGQAIGLAAGIGGLIAFESMKEEGAFLDYGRFRDPDAARAVHGVYLIGFVTFTALWLYGSYDSLSWRPAAAVRETGGVIGGVGRW